MNINTNNKTKILVLAEHDNVHLKPSTLNTIAAANELAKTISLETEIVLLVIGYQCQSVSNVAASLKGLTKILTMDAPAFEHLLAENVALELKALAHQFNYILTPATTFGKNILPRFAALLGMGQISDVMKFLSSDTFIRPMYAGNVLATVQSFDPIKIMTVRVTAFDPLDPINTVTDLSSSSKVPIESLQSSLKDNKDHPLSIFIQTQSSDHSRPELTSARIVISGGRGLQSRENFKLLEDIADKLGAAIGASRAAVDAGFVPNDYQVGQTGKIVAPELYIAVGISGAIQHLAGMKDSKVIVAINKDPDAPIFQIADYSLVGDLFQILPQLSQALS